MFVEFQKKKCLESNTWEQYFRLILCKKLIFTKDTKGSFTKQKCNKGQKMLSISSFFQESSRIKQQKHDVNLVFLYEKKYYTTEAT